MNTNPSKAKKLKEVMDKENLNWRSFTNQGDISARWTDSTPTYYILDHKGIIRYKWFGYPGEKALDTALQTLIRKAEGSAQKTPK